MHILENEQLRIEIADKGAELCSVYDKAADSERIWTADPAVWNRHAPILFPFVGKVNAGKYRVGGREYEMKTQHGFARDLPFVCVEETESLIRQRLCSTAETKAIYPFDFVLELSHALDADNPRRLCIGWRVQNTGKETMYYSIGGHPGFLLPAGTKKEDCYLLFPGHTALRYFQANAEGFALPEKEKLLRPENGFVKYQADVPDTWIFSGQGIDEVGIALPDRSPYVTLYCPQFPLLAVWANPKGSFICLEPWYGRCDDAGFAGTLAEKPGIETLEPGQERAFAYAVLFHKVGE